MMRANAARAGGVFGPAAFFAGWVVGSMRTDGYSVVEDAISRLAAIGASTRWVMTAGFLGFTGGVAIFAFGLREVLPGPAWLAALAASVATFAVALFPLDHSGTVDLLHGAAAFSGYVALSALPLLAAPALARSGRHRWACASRVSGTVSALALAATLFGPAHGLFQRIGVTTGDAWIVAASLILLRPARRS